MCRLRRTSKIVSVTIRRLSLRRFALRVPRELSAAQWKISAATIARPIYDQNLAVERVAAAVEAARALPFPFTLTARAENFLHGRADLDDTIRPP